MNLDEKRLKRQLEILQSWVDNKACGTAECATGFGKTYLAILALKRMLSKDKSRRSIVVVPTIQLKEQWEQELADHKIPNTSVYVINTIALQSIKLDTELLILDEIHRYASTEFKRLFELIDYKWILGLTATLNRLDGLHTLLEEKSPVVATVTQEEAEREGYISAFDEYNLGIELEPADRVTLNKLNKEFHKYFGMFGHDFKLAMNCTSKTGSEEYAAKHNLEAKLVAFHANRFNYFMRQRKEFLYKASCKIKATLEIINKLSTLKTVTFSESTDFADELTINLGDESACYHSKLQTTVVSNGKIVAVARKENKKTLFHVPLMPDLLTYKEVQKLYPGCKKMGGKLLKGAALKKFADNRTKVRVMNTAKALDQGFNVEDIELAIITSSTTNPTQHIQRVGRAVRKFIYKDGTRKRPIIVNIYIKDSQDEKWLTARQTDSKTGKPINSQVKWIKSINEIRTIDFNS